MKRNYNQGKSHPKFIDLTNIRFGKLVAKEYIIYNTKSTKKVYRWQCDCDCGSTAFVRTNILNSGVQTQCKKCAIKNTAKNNTLPDNKSVVNRAYKHYRYQAIKRNLPFELTLEEFITIIKSDCNYCGEPPRVNDGEIRYMRNGLFLRNGIDRINSTIGYVSNNVVPCCNICNWMKSDLSIDDFITHIDKIQYHRQGVLKK